MSLSDKIQCKDVYDKKKERKKKRNHLQPHVHTSYTVTGT